MTAPKPPLRDRVARLRKDPRIAAFSLIGPGGQVFDLVDELVAELEALQVRLAELDRRTGGLSALHLQVAELESRVGPARHFADQHPLRSR